MKAPFEPNLPLHPHARSSSESCADRPAPASAVTLFNGYVGASVAFAFVQTGVFAALAPDGALSFDELVTKTGCLPRRMEALVRAACVLGYLCNDALGRLAWTDAGRELHINKGYFTWSVGGYGRFFRELGSVARDDRPWDSLRDGRFVALGSDQNNAALMRTTLYSVLDTIRFERVADLGCGNAGRLIDFCGRYPDLRGVGIDINTDAILLARQNVTAHALDARIQLHCQDVLRSIADDEVRQSLADVDVVTCFMMLHDLVNLPGMRDHIFERLREGFPRVQYFVIADTSRMASPVGLSELPIFNVGFELVHAFMDVQIPDQSVYLDMFERAGLKLERCEEFGTPNMYLYLLRA